MTDRLWLPGKLGKVPGEVDRARGRLAKTGER